MTSLYIFGRRRPLPGGWLRGNHLLDVILFSIWAVMNGGVFYWQWCLMPMETLERVIRVLGHIIQLNLGLILFPITRQSVWLLILGMSFEKATKYHRFLGRVVVMVMTAHLVGWYVRWAINTEDGSLDASDSDSFDYAGTTPTGRIWHWQLKPVTLYGEGAYLCAILILATSWRIVRDASFEVFYYTHHLVAIMLVLANLHSFLVQTTGQDQLMYYMAPGILLYLIDRIIRVARYTTPTGPFNMRAIADADLTEIELLEPSFDFKPGQYCFLCIPELSELEWHPFSISSTPAFETIYNQVVIDHQEEKDRQPRKRRGAREEEQGDRKKVGKKVEDDESLLPPTPVSFHIRGLSSESWSRQLFFMVYGQYGDGIAPEGALLVNAAGKIIGPSTSSSSASINADLRRTKRLSSRGKEGQKTLRVLVDGPYGNTFEECKAYQNLIFICGGIGITSMIGILEALAIENQHIRDLELAEDVNYFDLIVEDEKRQSSEYEEETEDKEVEKKALLRNEKEKKKEKKKRRRKGRRIFFLWSARELDMISLFSPQLRRIQMTDPHGDLLQVSLYLTTPSNVPTYPGSVKPPASVPLPTSPSSSAVESPLVAEATRNKMTMSTNMEIQPLLSRISNGRPNIGAWLDTVKFSIQEELEQENRVKELKRENRRDGEGHHSPPLASVTHYSTYPASSSGLACPCCLTTCGEEDSGPILVGTFVCGPEGMMEQTMDFCQQKSDETVRLVGHPHVYRL